MAKQNTRRERKENNGTPENLIPIEDGSSTDESSHEEYEALQKPEEMELHTENVYRIHEQIQLDWPSLTVCMKEEEGRILIEQSIPGTSPSIIDLEVNLSGDSKRTIAPIKKVETAYQANRIRAKNDHVYTISDRSIEIYTTGLVPVYSKAISGGYGISLYKSCIFYGDGSFAVQQKDLDGKQINYIDINQKEIFTVASISENEAFVGTREVSLVDFRCKGTKSYLVNECDINSIAYNGDNLIVTGDDKGALRIFDIRQEAPMELIQFHQSPISHTQFSTKEVFASASSCEIVMWDMSYEETEGWEYHKYLSFVHQGQAYYKDFEFIADDIIMATSESGLCIFSPHTHIEPSN
ncbi:ribosome assembly protein RRB1 [Nematocida parisii]|nr:ribosome assembly protein RRB1 [Nematocida parisii]KAI5129520.1 ribosome assembly protein RRB1 [Nematocida parisii]KAI5141242.1 ribosome assembly protein RRB1 [Nematocida parisii]